VDLRAALGALKTVPVHAGRDVANGTLRGILDDVGLGIAELRDLL